MGYGLSALYSCKKYYQKTRGKNWKPKNLPTEEYVMDLLKTIGGRKREIP